MNVFYNVFSQRLSIGTILRVLLATENRITCACISSGWLFTLILQAYGKETIKKHATFFIILVFIKGSGMFPWTLFGKLF